MATAAQYGVNINVSTTGVPQAQQLLANLSTRTTALTAQDVTLLIKTLGHTQAVAAINQLQGRLNVLNTTSAATTTALGNTGSAVNNIVNPANNAGTAFSNLLKNTSNLGGALSSLPGPLGQAANSIGQVSSAASSVTSAVGITGGAILGLVAIAATATTAIGAFAINMALAADDAAELAANLNIPLGELNALKLIAEENSGTLEGLTSAQNRFRAAMTKGGEDNDRVNISLANLGLSYEELSGMSEKAAMAQVVLRARTLDTAEAWTAAKQIIGTSARTQGEAIIALSTDFETATARTRDQTAATQALKEIGGNAETSINNLKIAVKTLSDQLALQFADPFVNFLNGLSATLKELRQFQGVWNAVKATLGAPLTVIDRAVEGAGELGAMLGLHSNIKKTRGTKTNTGGATGSWEEDPKVTIQQVQQKKGEHAVKEAKEKLQILKETTNVQRVQRELLKGTHGDLSASHKAELLAVAAQQDAHLKSVAAQKTGASAAKSAANEAIRNAERIAKLGADTILNIERERLVRNEVSQEQLAIFDTTKGRLKEITDEEKKIYIEHAKQGDQLKYNEELRKQFKERADEALKTEEEITKMIDNQVTALRNAGIEIQKNIDAEKKDEQRKQDLFRMNAGLGPKGIEVNTKLVGIVNEAEDARRTENERFDRGGVFTEEATNIHLANLKRINDGEAASLEQFRADYAEREQILGDWTMGAKSAFNEYIESAANSSAAYGDLFKSTFQGMENSLTQFIMTGSGGWKAFTASVIEGLVRIQAQAAISGIFKLLGGAFGLGAGATAGPAMAGSSMSMIDQMSAAGFAKGAVFQGGNPVPFKSGGIVHSPTFFGMGGGRTGLMGEQGSEAIMPLTRTADGSLGVKSTTSSSGDIINNITINVESTGDAESDGNMISQKVVRAIQEISRGEIVKARRVGGINNPL